jgi:hypothetical protein
MFPASAIATESPFANHSTLSCFATANSFLKDFLGKKGHNRLFRSQRGPIKYLLMSFRVSFAAVTVSTFLLSFSSLGLSSRAPCRRIKYINYMLTGSS